MKFLSFSKTKRRHEEKYIDVFLSKKKSISPQNKCFLDFQQWKKTTFIETFLGNKSKLISTDKQKSKKIRNWKKVSFSLPHKTWVCCTMWRAFCQERGEGGNWDRIFTGEDIWTSYCKLCTDCLFRVSLWREACRSRYLCLGETLLPLNKDNATCRAPRFFSFE